MATSDGPPRGADTTRDRLPGTAEVTGDRPPRPAELYDQYFGPAIFERWAGLLLERAAPRPGERVLDLACGTGIVARQLAPRIGPAGRLVALDLRPTMLAVGRERPVAGGPAIEWVQGDATALPLPDGAFDLVVCQQGLQFFPDRTAALREVRRVLDAGSSGRALFAVWKSLPHQSLFADLVQAEARHLAPLGITMAHAAAPFTLSDPGELRALFSLAGFAQIEISDHALDVQFSAPDRFVANAELAYAAVMPEYLRNPSAFQPFVAAVERDLQPALARYRQGETLVFPLHAHLVAARP